MQIEADISTMEINGGRMRVFHGNESAFFTFFTFKRGAFENNNDVFTHINRFWARQSEDFQYSVFKIYKRIEDYLDDIFTKEELADKLKEAIKELYELHPFQKMKNWMINESNLRVPEGFGKTYIDDPDRNTSLEKTYLYDDYRDLMVLCLSLRLMVPIWASYVRLMRNHAGNGLKELSSFKLLERTEFSNHPAMDKLHGYIRANIRKENNTVVPVNFISEYDQPYWILSLLCVRKICVGDLDPTDPRANLVTLVSNFIKIKTVYNDSDFASRLHIKDTKEGSGSDENKISTMEGVRTNTEIAIVEAEELKFSVENIYNVADKFFPMLPKILLENALETSKILMNRETGNNRILPPQRMLMGWVMKKAIVPFGIDFLDLDIQVRCLALTQAALWYRGHTYLALLSTAYSSAGSDHLHVVNTTAGRSRVSDDLQKELRKWFPHVRTVQTRKAPAKESCFVLNDIDLTCNDLSNAVWRATADKELYRQCLGESHNRQIPILPEIRIKLMELAIDIGSGNFFNNNTTITP